MKRLVAHFENPHNPDLQRALDFVNNVINSTPAIEGGVNLVNTAKTTVVAVQSASQKDVYLFGIARYSETDDAKFDKEKGIRIAEWRAKHACLAELEITEFLDKSTVVDMFHGIAYSLNEQFKDKHSNANLVKVPISIIEGTVEFA